MTFIYHKLVFFWREFLKNCFEFQPASLCWHWSFPFLSRLHDSRTFIQYDFYIIFIFCKCSERLKHARVDLKLIRNSKSKFFSFSFSDKLHCTTDKSNEKPLPLFISVRQRLIMNICFELASVILKIPVIKKCGRLHKIISFDGLGLTKTTIMSEHTKKEGQSRYNMVSISQLKLFV